MNANDRLTDAVDTLAETLGCPLALEDAEFRMLTYSAVPGHVEDPVRNEAIIRRRTPERWLEWIDRIPGRRDQLESGIPLVVEDAFPGLRRRMIKALRDDTDVVAYLWILEGAAGFPDSLPRDLADFEDRVTGELSHAGGSRSRAEESRLVRLLVSGDIAHETLAGAGISTDWQVTASTIFGADGEYLHYQDLQELSDVARQDVQDRRGHASMTGIIERRVCRLDFYAAPPSGRDLRALERCVLEGQRRLKGPLVMAVGNSVALPDAGQSWLQAQAAGELLATRGHSEGAFAAFSDVQAECVIRAVATFLDSRRELVENLIQTLEDRDHGDVPERSKTMAAFLDHNCSIPRAAEELRLHPNSLRYRIRRFQRDLPVQLDDPMGRLALHLASLAAREGTRSG